MSTEYPDEFVRRLEILWGEGFLSPGGPNEIIEMLDGVDISGKTILDLGCGAGGPAIVLARELGAAKIIGVDVEPGLLQRAKQNATKAGLAHQIEFTLIRPGPLKFAPNSFDIVFSKDSIIQIPGKAKLFGGVHRVLRDGGTFVASDWLGGENWAKSPEWRDFCDLTDWTSHLATAGEIAVLMEAAGFVHISMRDRNSWYIEEKKREVDRIEGPLRQKIVEVVGPTGYAKWLTVNRANLAAVVAGALRPTHFRGYRASAPAATSQSN
jgi:ubiquinone/menaquinone biosynthesis C-methylase UbiE